MNLRAYATRGIIWGQRQLFAKWLKDFLRKPYYMVKTMTF